MEKERTPNFVKKNDEETTFVYPNEIIENNRRLRYQLYLRVGGMSDILRLHPTDFFGIIEEANEESKKISGTTSVKPMKDSNREMIENAKRARQV